MATTVSSFWRDANRVPITTDGLTAITTLTTNATNTTVNPAIFTITGAVEIRALWGVVTTDLGSNHTAAAWRLNDQTSQIYITAVGGTTLSSIKAGSLITKPGVVATALTKLDNAAGVLVEPAALETFYFTPFIAVKKTAALTQIEYRYATNQSPTTGAIQFFCRFLPLTIDGDVTGVAT